MEIIGLIMLIIIAYVIYHYFYLIVSVAAIVAVGFLLLYFLGSFLDAPTTAASTSTTTGRATGGTGVRPSRKLLDHVAHLCGGRKPVRKGRLFSITEKHRDPDGRVYMLEYMSTPDGNHAIAYCRRNPWGNTPNAGVAYTVGHVSSEGFICLGPGHPGRSAEQSPYPIDNVIQRTRYWCTAFSYFKETGEFPQL